MTVPPPADDLSGDASLRGAFAVLVLLGVITVLLGVWAGLQWSLISVGVNGRVTSTAWAEEGPKFKVIEFADGTALTVDEAVIHDLGGPPAVTGRDLSKVAGDRTLIADGESIALRPSSEAWTTVVGLTVVVGFALVRGGSALRRRNLRMSADRWSEVDD